MQQLFILRGRFFLLFLFFYSVATHAQRTPAQKVKPHTMTPEEAKTIKKDAASLFTSENYSAALTAYEDLVKGDPNNPEFNYRLGYCLLMTNVDKARATVYLEKAAKAKNPKKEIPYLLGVAYMHAERWDDAIQSFEDYKKNSHSKMIKDFPDVDRQEEMCENAKDLTAHPVNVTFENCGKAINSVSEDYNPFISADGKTLVFSSRRKGNAGGFIDYLGIYAADIYFSTWKDTAWTKAKSVGAGVNSEWDEESVGLSADGNLLLAYFDNADAASNIAVSVLKGKSWQKALLLGSPVNTKDIQTGGSITLDGSTIYFASERKDTKGGSDLFKSKRLDNNDWGPAENLGPVINTRDDEDAPFISIDGKTLYFSSKGHNSMGGYDVFRSTYDDQSESWSEPVNIGYPLNNADDNLFISMTGDQKCAYITATRKDGLGDRDIYKVTYQDTTDHPFLALISGSVISETNARVEITKATLQSKDDQSMLTYKPFVPANEFVFAAKPGSYLLTVEGFNFASYSESIVIPNEYPLKDIIKKVVVKTGKP